MCAGVDTGKENQDKVKGKYNITIYSLMTCVSFGIYLSGNLLLI